MLSILLALLDPSDLVVKHNPTAFSKLSASQIVGYGELRKDLRKRQSALRQVC